VAHSKPFAQNDDDGGGADGGKTPLLRGRRASSEADAQPGAHLSRQLARSPAPQPSRLRGSSLPPQAAAAAAAAAVERSRTAGAAVAAATVAHADGNGYQGEYGSDDDGPGCGGAWHGGSYVGRPAFALRDSYDAAGAAAGVESYDDIGFELELQVQVFEAVMRNDHESCTYLRGECSGDRTDVAFGGSGGGYDADVGDDGMLLDLSDSARLFAASRDGALDFGCGAPFLACMQALVLMPRRCPLRVIR
jgi:hypothetical protein